MSAFGGSFRKGNFTMPAEAGYERLSLELAEKWGADMLRDSNGTTLSRELLDAGYGIYSTVCMIREHNEWIREHMYTRQQCFLLSEPKIAKDGMLTINIMEGFFQEQFSVNAEAAAMPYWQVFDRTANEEISRNGWKYTAETGAVTVLYAEAWHKYTVSFLAWRVWEEISMYNHITNGWTGEPLMQLDPIYPEAREYLKDWLIRWCAEHPETAVVRFTSLFYNFTWIWGDDERNRNLYSDWAGYDFAVSPAALALFAEAYGYELCAEDFIHKGHRHSTHMPPNKQKRDWMNFIADFVRRFAKELTNIVHMHGKRALVFYDDSWIGLEPYNGKFREFGFDGIIKCVFNGYEARLCAGVDSDVHEIRFHPYLFPVGLGGAPTFSEGGDPAADALQYWIHIRRALLRSRVERAGLGGYPHLIEGFPVFVDTMTDILVQFRQISELHSHGEPINLAPRIGVLTAWGSLRSWTLSGHFHETERFVLTHIIEALSGLPLDVRFLDFEDVKRGALKNFDVVINAGKARDAWSGGEVWADCRICEILTAWVHGGGAFVGIGEPTAVEGFDSFFRLAHVLGVDLDCGERANHGKPALEAVEEGGIKERDGIFMTDKNVRVLSAKNGVPTHTVNRFGKGSGVYLSDFMTNPASNRFLLNMLLHAAGITDAEGITDDGCCECAVFPGAGRIALVNNSHETRTVSVVYGAKTYSAALEPAGIKILEL
ncbi:MAG: 1,3-beta-galactosyl-N-acetylhexosamine phosphorylase [Clostridium sp.]|jgi:1,3-beta-galactosyl-N-acetylhexosamine phosphorylase|nr:1,3-beta-galactosyl-N-acetylhexosamine phosphorylase [Clostridium sp.]